MQKINDAIKNERTYVIVIPSLSGLYKISANKVYKYLSVIPQSQYRGQSVKQIQTTISWAKAIRHLSQLIILNHKKISDLHAISDHNSSQEDSEREADSIIVEESSYELSRQSHQVLDLDLEFPSFNRENNNFSEEASSMPKRFNSESQLNSDQIQ